MVGALVRLIRGSATRAVDEGLARKSFRLPPALDSLPDARRRKIEEAVALGALLGLVARIDDEFSAAEERVIERTLAERAVLSADETALVIAAAREARESSVEIHQFTREFSRRPYRERVEVVELLFHLAYADRKLHGTELEMIRKIAGLCWVEHRDFIAAKLKAADAAGARKPTRSSRGRIGAPGGRPGASR